MLLPKDNIRHVSTVTHEGKVLIVVTVAEKENGQEQHRLYYTVKQDGFESSALNQQKSSDTPTGWEAFEKATGDKTDGASGKAEKRLVPLPDDHVGDASVAKQEKRELTYKDEKEVERFLLCSVYDSADLTADAPVQLVSHNGFVYLFRQRKENNTLLADRFVLDGMTNTLCRKLEVRFKRSRQRYQPIQAMKIKSNGEMESVDSLDFRDMNNQAFYEPTIEICPEIIKKLHDGRFAVVVTPTNEADRHRWHIFFSTEAEKNVVHLVTLRAGEESMFTVQDYWFRRQDTEAGTASYESIPGLIHRGIKLQDSQGDLTIVNGLAAVKYDVQREQQTQGGPQLVREASKVMLAVPTDRGIAALSFAIGANGTLAEIGNPNPHVKTLRSREREVMLPPDLLEKIRGYAGDKPAAGGVISGMSESKEKEGGATHVRVKAKGDPKALGDLTAGDLVRLSDTASYNGVYKVLGVEGDSFTVAASFKNYEVGHWEKVQKDVGPGTEGEITGYDKAGTGDLKFHAFGHGLKPGKEVQVVNCPDLDGEYPVIEVGTDSFTLQRPWAGGEAINVTTLAEKRRGLVFDGEKDWIEIPMAGRLKLGAGFALDAWVKLDSTADQTILATVPDPVGLNGQRKFTWQAILAVSGGHFSFGWKMLDLGDDEVPMLSLTSAKCAPVGDWVHVACLFDGTELRLLINGKDTAPRLEAAAEKARMLMLTQPARYDAGRLVSRGTDKVLCAIEGKVSAAPAGDSSQQSWRIEAIGKASPVTDFLIRHIATGQVLKHGLTLGERKEGDKDQVWQLEPEDDGRYRLCADGKKALEADADGRLTLGDVSQEGDSQLWQFVPLDAAKPIVVDAPALTLAGRKQWSPDGKLAVCEKLQGQLAEVRVWTQARTEKEIVDAMHLPLTGRETGLAGYWRLGAVGFDDEGRPSVADFSVAGNHGIVQGAPYACRKPLDRKLKKDSADKDGVDLDTYSNGDLVAVREGAMYEESFEFRARNGKRDYIDPNKAGGEGVPIFKPSLWGRPSRDSDQVIIINPERGPFTFGNPDGAILEKTEGWCRASCKFMVPQGVRLLRCFEVKEVQGDWTTLEIRRPALKLVSDTVSLREDKPEETAKSSSLLREADNPLQVLYHLDRAEREKAALVAQYKWVKEQSARFIQVAQIRKEYNELQEKFARLEYLDNLFSGRIPSSGGSRQVLCYKPERESLRTWSLENIGRRDKLKNELDLYDQLENELTKIKSSLDNKSEHITCLISKYLESLISAWNIDHVILDQHRKLRLRLMKVRGELLRNSSAASRLHAQESCAGHITLRYRDAANRFRQAYFDTAYDADGKGEEWLPEDYPTALALDGTKAINLPGGVFKTISKQITIEFWARCASIAHGEATKSRGGSFLTARSGDGKAFLRIRLPNEQVSEVVWEAGQKAIESETTDRLEAKENVRIDLYRERWTHWAFVKDCGKKEMRIYANGKLLRGNDPKKKVADKPDLREQPIVFSAEQPSTGKEAEAKLGGSFEQAEGCWTGQIAELRIWNIALGERELEANSVLTLTGNEPGLVAYYRMNEAQGNVAHDRVTRDRTGGEHDLDITISDAQWTACTAPIGRAPSSAIDLLEWPMDFDGIGHFLPLPPMTLQFSAGFTIEARVLYSSFNSYSRIIDLLGNNGNSEYKPNIVLSNFGTEGTLWLYITLPGMIDNQPFTLQAKGLLRPEKWSHVAVTVQADSKARLYIDGKEIVSGNINERLQGSRELPKSLKFISNYLGKSNAPNDQLFAGKMEYVRLWEAALSAEEIGRHARQESSGRGVVCAEYSRIVVDAEQKKTAMMMRCLAWADADGVRLLDEQRIEELDLQWIGNAQINPTLIGYIEGAPPVPTENLTEEDNYNGATSVELVESSEVSYSWTREQDASLGTQIEGLIGYKSSSEVGFGFMTSAEEVKSGVGGKWNSAYHWQNASTVDASHSLAKIDRLELRGSQEREPNFPNLGKRFIPKNVGYALVTSGLADVFVSKLKKSGRMVGYQLLPAAGVPLDVNTITFMMNPAYTMAGSLDGMTGSSATSERFFRQVPEMRAQYGSLYPASYFRLKEAYDLKEQIDRQDQQHQAYFNQFNAGLVDEASLDRQAGGETPDESPVGLSSSEGSSKEVAELDKQIDGIEKEIDQLNRNIGRLEATRSVENDALASKKKEEIESKKKILDSLRQQRTEQQKKEQGTRKEGGQQRQAEIEKTHTDLSKRAHASESFAAWQRKMENLQVRAGKRNIVNTYVWDADGGFHAEEQQFASTVEHTISGSFDMSVAIGGKGTIAIAKVLVELDAYHTVNMTQTMSKTEGTSKGMELHVALGGVESRVVTDHRDYPLLPGEKVDRYRFMTFYLENSVDHWHDFFNDVVDPEWLASNDEEARALRQTQNAAPNKVWRVLHRVTYVERPALMGFGRELAPCDEKQELQDQIQGINDRLAKLEGLLSEIKTKIEPKS